MFRRGCFPADGDEHSRFLKNVLNVTYRIILTSFLFICYINIILGSTRITLILLMWVGFNGNLGKFSKNYIFMYLKHKNKLYLLRCYLFKKKSSFECFCVSLTLSLFLSISFVRSLTHSFNLPRSDPLILQ